MNLSRRTFLTTLTTVLSLSVFWSSRRYREPAMGKSLNAPSNSFNLSGWELQIPGPKNIKNLDGYTSEYFYLDSSGRMCFWVDCTKTGHTANSEYVRSELYHLKYWRVNDIASKKLSATLSVDSNAYPDKVTVLQIHGITDSGDNVPPLLRIALNEGSLYAFIKTDNSGENTEKITLDSNVGSGEFSCVVEVRNKCLIISTNGTEKVNRDISFWQHANYFKAGCYPQSHRGKVMVMFSRLSAKIN